MKFTRTSSILLLLLSTCAILTACGDSGDGMEQPTSTSPAMSQDLGQDMQRDTADMGQGVIDMASDAQDFGAEPADLGEERDQSESPDQLRTPDAWRVETRQMTTLHRPSPEDGCLRATGTQLTRGEVVEIAAANSHWLLATRGGEAVGLIARSHTEELSRPGMLSDLPAGSPGSVVEAVALRTWGEDGCPIEQELSLESGASVELLARFHDDQYKGWAISDRMLSILPIRKVQLDDEFFPWESAVQLVQSVPTGGFVTGAGVVIGPHHILTVAHLKVDETFCYSRAAVTNLSEGNRALVCANITAVKTHPQIDLAIVTLEKPEREPHATLATTSPRAGQRFYTTDYSTLKRNALRDGTVDMVGSENSSCAEWPSKSTFSAKEQLLSPGDSGGPAFSQDTLIGLVHDTRCKETEAEGAPHLFINVATFSTFIQDAMREHAE